MDDAVAVGLIGYGVGGRQYHAPLIAATPGLILKSIASSRADEIKRDHPGAAPTDVDGILDDPAIGLVVISTPHDSHVDLARRCLLAGKAVVIDKPFAITARDAADLADLAAARGVFLSAFHNRRWDGDFLTIAKAVSDGLVGAPATFESHFDRFRPKVQDRWREHSGPGAGVWWDLGPHLADQAIHLFGAPQSVSGDLAILRPGGLACDYAHVVLHYPSLRVVLHASMLVAETGPRFALHGDTGSLIVPGFGDPSARLVRWQDGERAETTLAVGPDQPDAYYRAVRAALRDGADNPVTPGSAVLATRAIELAEQSAAAGRVLPFG